MYETSIKFADAFENIVEYEGKKLMPMTEASHPAIILLYCFAHDYGKDVLTFESETISILLANDGYTYLYSEKINNMIAIINQMDNVMSTSDGFLYATIVLNDLGNTAENIDSVSIEHMVWAIIMLMALFGASNNPLTGDAMRTVAARLMDEGWTTPPVFMPSEKLFNLMPYADRELPKKVDKHKDRFFYINNPDTKVNIENQYDNYFEMHKDMLFYLQQEDTLYSTITNGIVI